MQDIKINLPCPNCKNNSLEHYYLCDDYSQIAGEYCELCKYESKNGKLIYSGSLHTITNIINISADLHMDKNKFDYNISKEQLY